MQIKLYIKTIAIICFLYPSWSFSFSLNNSAAASFEKDEVTVNVSDDQCTNIDKTPSQLLAMVKEATNKFWNTVPTSRLKLKAGSLVTVSSVFETDALCTSNSGSCTINPDLVVSDQILVSCNTDTSTDNFNGDTSILALGLPNNLTERTIKGAVILLNDISGTSLANYPDDQFISVLAHEIGHAIGLGHSPVEDSLMYYKNHPNRKRLGLDDMDGVSYLYPRSQPIGCGTIKNVTDDKESGSPILAIVFILIFIPFVSKLLKNRYCPE